MSGLAGMIGGGVIVLFVIFVLLYMTFNSASEAVTVMLSVVYAMTGGIVLQWLLGYNFSVAVWVGYIALYGIAVQTGEVMVVYLHEALDHRLRTKGTIDRLDVLEATIEGSVLRLRPKLMTVGTTILSLGPIMWATGVGSDVMKPIAAPIVGGMITSTISQQGDLVAVLEVGQLLDLTLAGILDDPDDRRPAGRNLDESHAT